MSDETTQADVSAEEDSEIPLPEEVPDDFLERLASVDEELAEAGIVVLGQLHRREDELEEVEEELDEVTSRLKRARADFENYKRRREEQEQARQARQTDEVLERIASIRTDLDRALAAEEQDLESVLEGVRMIRRDMDRLLDAEGLDVIEPEPGTPLDPHRHDVMVQTESDRPAGTIAEVFEPGYERDDRVLRAAKVAVSQEPADTDDAEEAH